MKTRTSQIDYTTGGETRGKVKTVRDSPAPPAGQEKIVNGDFEYSGTGAGLSDSPFNYVSLSQKSYYYKDSRNVNHRVALPAGFDAKRFAWKSDQTGKDLGNPPYEQAGDVQVWNRYDGSNHYAELTAAQAGSAIYQDIDTESDSDVQYIKDKGTLVIGITEFEPMDYQDADGNWIGFDADMAKLVAEKLGVEPVFTVINWDNKVFELNGKGIDVVWNGMTITTAAQESMECTNAYCNNAQVIVTK